MSTQTGPKDGSDKKETGEEVSPEEKKKKAYLKRFNDELVLLYSLKSSISSSKMNALTTLALEDSKYCRHVVHSVERFIDKSYPKDKLTGLYLIDNIVKRAQRILSASDVYGKTFADNLTVTVLLAYEKCLERHRAKILKLLKMWKEKKIFSGRLIRAILEALIARWPEVGLEEDVVSSLAKETLPVIVPKPPLMFIPKTESPDDEIICLNPVVSPKAAPSLAPDASKTPGDAHLPSAKAPSKESASNTMIPPSFVNSKSSHRSPGFLSSWASSPSLPLFKAVCPTKVDAPRKRQPVFPPPLPNHVTLCSTTLWIGSLGKANTEEQLHSICAAFGNVTRLDMIPSRGCAYINMESRSTAVEAFEYITGLASANLLNRALRVAWAPGRALKENTFTCMLAKTWRGDLGVAYLPVSLFTTDARLLLRLTKDDGEIDERSLGSVLRERLEAARSGRETKREMEEDDTGKTPASTGNSSMDTEIVDMEVDEKEIKQEQLAKPKTLGLAQAPPPPPLPPPPPPPLVPTLMGPIITTPIFLTTPLNYYDAYGQSPYTHEPPPINQQFTGQDGHALSDYQEFHQGHYGEWDFDGGPRRPHRFYGPSHFGDPSHFEGPRRHGPPPPFDPFWPGPPPEPHFRPPHPFYGPNRYRAPSHHHPHAQYNSNFDYPNG